MIKTPYPILKFRSQHILTKITQLRTRFGDQNASVVTRRLQVSKVTPLFYDFQIEPKNVNDSLKDEFG